MTKETRKKMIERVRALLAKTMGNGCTEQEANAALGMAQKLMAEYALSETDMTFGGEGCTKQGKLYSTSNVVPLGMAVGVAKFCGCKTWREPDKNLSRIVFFGLESDVLMAEWLLSSLTAFVFRECTNHMAKMSKLLTDQKSRNREINGFTIGASNRINARLKELSSTPQPMSNGKDLVVVKDALVTEAFKELDMKLKNSAGRSVSVSQSGMAAGKAAGDRAAFNRPVNGQTGPTLLGR